MTRLYHHSNLDLRTESPSDFFLNSFKKRMDHLKLIHNYAEKQIFWILLQYAIKWETCENTLMLHTGLKEK